MAAGEKNLPPLPSGSSRKPQSISSPSRRIPKRSLRPLLNGRNTKTGQPIRSEVTVSEQSLQEIHSLKARLAQQDILISSLQAEISSLHAGTVERTRKVTHMIDTIGQAFKEYQELVWS